MNPFNPYADQSNHSAPKKCLSLFRCPLNDQAATFQQS